MSYTPMSDLGQQGLFDITRLLLQQPDLAALSETLTRLVQQSALADEAAIILWNAGNHRAARYACDEAGHPVSYEDETVLAHGPVRRLLSRPDALHCDHETFADTWPQLIRSGLYRPFGYYSLLPLAADGRIFGGCEFLRRDNRPWSEKEFQRLHTFAQIVAVVTEQIQNRVSNNVDYDLLCHERDNFRIWWRSPTRCSRDWISTSWSARWRKRSIATSGSTPSAWCCAATAREAQHLFHALS